MDKYSEDEFIDVSFMEERLERRRRVRMIQVVAPGIIAALLIINKLINPEGNSFGGFYFSSYIYSLLTIMCLGVSGIGLLMTYLQTGFKKATISKQYNYEYNKELNNALYDMKNLKSEDSDKISRLESELQKISSRLEAQQKSSEVISIDDRQELVKTIKSRIESEAADKIYEEIKLKVTEIVTSDDRNKMISARFSETLGRLQGEVTSLSRRGNLNLALGIITTVIGLSILGYFVVQNTHQTIEPIGFMMGFLPRLSLVILIEVFAYFFLKLYKASLAEIKYFQNEMTNIEAKQASLMVAMSVSDDKTCAAVIKTLSATERNHILEKGQTTVELEKAKVDKEEITNIIKAFSDFVKKQK
jgi:hypothetical protein